jgi:predicted transcriptional regulator
MEEHYKTLQTIFDITKEDPQPLTYKCRPREIILRQYQSWTTIEKHLKNLEEEGLVLINKEDTVIIKITKAGIGRIMAANKFKYDL